MLQRRGPKSWLVVLLALALVGAACGGGDDDDGGSADTDAEQVEVVQGGTLTYASDQQLGGFNNGTSADNKAALQYIVINVYPQVFRTLPDFRVVLNDELMDSAEQVKDSPQTIVFKIKQAAVWSDGTPISAEDFIYAWQSQNGSNKDLDVATTATRTSSRSPGRTTARP